MSSDVGDVTESSMRRVLTEAAARLVAAGGAAALSARKVAREAETSTMAVYTHFGSMDALVAAVVAEGFHRLEQRLLEVGATDDPLADVARQTAAYVGHARENAELYAVMFGTAPLGAYRPESAQDLTVGRRETLDRIGDALQRAVTDGRLRDPGGAALSFRWWTLVHGYVLLEAAGYLALDRGPTRVLAPLLVDLFVGEGDAREAAEASVSRGLGAG